MIRGIAFLLTDVFRLCFFVGTACLIIGILRTRRWRREAKAAETTASGTAP
jgi:hypothetical protein